MSDDEWITVEEAASILGVSPRQVHRYGETRLKTKQAKRRTLFFRADVEALAQEFGLADRPPPAPRPAKQELVPAGEMLDYLRERDRQLAEAQSKLEQALLTIGRLQGELERANELRRLLDDTQAERDRLREEIASRKPWWKRLRG